LNSRAARSAAAGVFPAVLLLAAAGMPAPAAAEIYGYVDSFGHFTYTNLPPPKDAQVTDVIPDEPAGARPSAQAVHDAEVAALNDRIRLLELERARPQVPPVEYAPAPAYMPEPIAAGCGPDWAFDCNGYWWGPTYVLGGWPRHYRGYYGRRPGYGAFGHGPGLTPGRGGGAFVARGSSGGHR
jgi:hypothetical protein